MKGSKITEKRNPKSLAAWVMENKGKAHTVNVGILARGNDTKAEDKKGLREIKKSQKTGGLTVLDVATWAEFGIGQPERPFIRGYVDAHRKDIEAFISKTVKGAAKSGKSKEWALERIGLYVQSGIQVFIAAQGEGTYPPNAQETIDRKGSATPLIDTGQLRSSLTYEVQK